MNRLRAFLNIVRPFLPITSQVVAGMCVGLLFLTVVTRLRLSLGPSPEVTIATILTFGLSALACVSFFRGQGRLITTIAFWSLPIWTLFQPVVLEFSLGSIQQFEVSQLASRTTEFGITFAIVMASLFPMACASTVLFTQKTIHRSGFLTGIGLSLVLVPSLLGFAISPNVAMWLAISGTILAGALAYYSQQFAINSTTLPPTSTSTDAPPRRVVSLEILFAASLGFAFAIAAFICSQIVLNNLISEFSFAGSFLLGIACGGLIPRTVSAATKWFSLATWGALTVLLFPLVTYLLVLETASISHTYLLFLSRTALLMLLSFPIGVLLRTAPALHESTSGVMSRQILAFSAGLCVALWSGITVTTAVGILLVATFIIAGGLLLLLGQLPKTWVQQIGLASLGCLVAAGFLLTPQLNMAYPEKLVYSGNAFSALRNGVEFSKLHWMDDGRLSHEFENLESRWSFWKHRGSQLMIRKDGLVAELHSTNSATCPKSAAEVIPGLFSLVAHPQVEHVLVLGMHTTTLQTCEAYPLRSVTVVDGVPFLDKVRDSLKSEWADDFEVQFINAELQFAVKARHAQTYDAIIAPETMSATTAGAGQFTQTFYQDVKRLLSQKGIFCQRLAYYDLGPEIIQKTVATLKSVFPQTLILESVPGEILLVGSLQTEPIISPEFVDRIQNPQARFLLSEIGWDWSIPVTRGTLNDAAVVKWLPEKTTPFSPQYPGLAFQIPVEVARWAPKSQQTRIALSKYGKTFGGYLEDDESLDIAQRLEDVQIAHKLIDANPDNIWGYRAAIKKQLLDRPRSKIMQVKHEGLKRRLHPDDQRRKDYIETLGKLAKAKTITPEMVDELIKYIHPFDPLLGTFVSHEAIQYLRKVDQPTDLAQLNNLLFTIYYSTPTDQSVRNVCEAIHIICEHPESVATDDARWDQLNGLVEILRYRWNIRWQNTEKISKFETIDTERSLAACELALETMGELAPAAGLSESDWNTRNEILNEYVVRRLKQHRSKQLRQYRLPPPTQ